MLLTLYRPVTILVAFKQKSWRGVLVQSQVLLRSLWSAQWLGLGDVLGQPTGEDQIKG